MSSILEDYYSSLHNVVLRDAQGNPSIFVKHYKQYSNEFYSGLPNHAHPAFIYQDNDGKLNQDKAILIAKYQSSELTSGGNHYSLPYKTPAFGNVRSLENKSWAINNTGLMTWADYGLLMLMLQKSILDGYSLVEACGRGGVPKGEYATWYPGLEVNAGETYAFMGWLYKCRTTHTADIGKLPENTPSLWEKLYRRGGVATAQNIWSKKINEGTNADQYIVGPMLTGSGPIEQCFLQNPTLECDLFGNMPTQIAGIRVGPKGQLQFIPYNTQYLKQPPQGELPFQTNRSSTNSQDSASLWRAIKVTNDAPYYEFCVPADPNDEDQTNNENTIYIRYNRETYKCDFTSEPDATATDGTNLYSTAHNTFRVENATNNGMKWTDIGVGRGLENGVPSILYESGLLPLPDTRIRNAFNNVYCGINTGVASGGGVTFFTAGAYYHLTTAKNYSALGAWNGSWWPNDASGLITSRLRARVTS